MAAVPVRKRRKRTPTVLQMEATECGAASLGIMLATYGRYVPLEVLRQECGISRDGSKASNVAKAARRFGMTSKGYRRPLDSLWETDPPFIVFWKFNHFLVVEGWDRKWVYLSDPAHGPRRVSHEEFDAGYTGVIITCEPGPDFEKGGRPPSTIRALRERLSRCGPALVFAVLASLLLVLPGLILPTLLRVFVDNILIGEAYSWWRPLFIGMLMLAIAQGSLTWIREYYLLRLETRMALSMSARFLWHVMRLPIGFFQQRVTGEVVSRVNINDQVASMLSNRLAANLLNLLLIGFYALLMVQYDLLLTGFAIFVAATNLLLLQYLHKSRTDMSRRMRQDHGKLIGACMGGLQAIETLKAQGAESDFFEQWAGYHAKVINASQRFQRSSRMLQQVPALLLQVNDLVVLGLGGFRVIQGYMTIGELIAFQTLVKLFLAPVNDLVNLATEIQELDGDVRRLEDVEQNDVLPELSDTAMVPAQPADAPAKLEGSVVLKDVTFGYSPLEPPLIDNFSLRLEPGQRVALVGTSGSGKSTVSKLVAGLYQPWSGEILFEGKPRSAYSRNTMAHSLAMVDQEIFVFSGTIRENLTLWDSSTPEAALLSATRDAQIHDTIAERPGGYSAWLQEGGANLSGGQRQRLEIARSLITNPSILILDEATSALDAMVEHEVDQCLRRRGCTCIIVAHRLSTVRDCQEIIVLDKGKAVERGTHDELMAKKGAYEALIRTT